VVLQSALDVARRPGNGAGPSGADHLTNVADVEGIAQKCMALSPLRGLSPKCSHAAIDGSQSSSSMAPFDLHLVGHEAPT
jgi:hypothetical protein